MRTIISLAVYLLAGACVHLILFGQPDPSSIASWGIIVFWPIVTGVALTAAVIVTVIVGLSCLWLWYFFGGLKDRVRLWRRRRDVGRKIKSRGFD